MASFPLLRFPVELQLHVLACLPDYHTLVKAVLAHPHLKQLFLYAPEKIIQGILSSSFHPQIRRLIQAIFLAWYHKVINPWTIPMHAALHDPEILLDSYSDRVSKIQFLSKGIDAFRVLRVLADYTKETNELAQAWAKLALYHASSLHLKQRQTLLPKPADPISSTEEVRIHRALWRLQLYAEIFPFRSHSFLVGSFCGYLPERLRERQRGIWKFFSGLPSWELAEIRSAEIFLSNRYLHLKTVAKDYDPPRSPAPSRILESWIDTWNTNGLIARLGYDFRPCADCDLRHQELYPPAMVGGTLEGEGADGPNGAWMRVQLSTQRKNDVMYRFWEALGLFLWDDDRLRRYGLMEWHQFTPTDGLERIKVTLELEGVEFERLCSQYLSFERMRKSRGRGAPRRPHFPSEVEDVMGTPFRCLG